MKNFYALLMEISEGQGQGQDPDPGQVPHDIEIPSHWKLKRPYKNPGETVSQTAKRLNMRFPARDKYDLPDYALKMNIPINLYNSSGDLDFNEFNDRFPPIVQWSWRLPNIYEAVRKTGISAQSAVLILDALLNVTKKAPRPLPASRAADNAGDEFFSRAAFAGDSTTISLFYNGAVMSASGGDFRKLKDFLDISGATKNYRLFPSIFRGQNKTIDDYKREFIQAKHEYKKQGIKTAKWFDSLRVLGGDRNTPHPELRPLNPIPITTIKPKIGQIGKIGPL